jgi:heme-degrading monooxygenase HmoA
MAFVRVGEFRTRENAGDEVARIYQREAIPLIRGASGNLSALLLRKHEQPDSFLAITVWRTSDDAEAYEKSGMAQEMVRKIGHTFVGPPTLTTYEGYGI